MPKNTILAIEIEATIPDPILKTDPETRMPPEPVSQQRFNKQNRTKTRCKPEKYFGFNSAGEFIISDQLYSLEIVNNEEKFTSDFHGLVLRNFDKSFCARSKSGYKIGMSPEEVGEKYKKTLLLALARSLNLINSATINKMDEKTLSAFNTYASALIDVPCEEPAILGLQKMLKDSFAEKPIGKRQSQENRDFIMNRFKRKRDRNGY